MEETKIDFAKIKEALPSLIDKLNLLILGLLLLLFPLFVTTQTTDLFVLPKQALLAVGVLLILLFFGLKTLLVNKVRIRKTPFDIPVLIFTLVLFISSFLAVNKVDSLITFTTILFVVLAYFAITNTAKKELEIIFLVGSLVIGGLLSAAIATFSFYKIYILPFKFTQAQGFTTFGSVFDQALYFALVLVVAISVLLPILMHFRKDKKLNRDGLLKIGVFGLSSIIVLIGLTISIYQLIKPQITGSTLYLLPLETGFQTAFAAISQDAGRIFQGFLFGSGFGTYATDFTRFKQATINLNPNLWSITFLRSSSYVLELLATTGILGLLSFLYLIYKVVRERPIFIPLILTIAASFVLPFSFVIQTLFFVLLALFVAIQGIHYENRYYDVELQLVALKKGILSFTAEGKEVPQEGYAKFLPYFVFGVILFIIVVLGFVSFSYLKSNLLFQQSLIAASQNNGNLTYKKQTEAINVFPFVDVYQRIFAQTNLSVANSVYLSISQGSSPSAQTTQTIYTLIQQSINAARNATTYAPLTVANWQNLASIYRNLIGLGQSADSFALLASQQAVTLDPNNPQEYINLGGLYYQLQLWDRALEQFQKAATLKPDFPNAYYNIGHTYEQKGDLKSALTQYQTVKTLVSGDKFNSDKIASEIDVLQKRISSQETPVVITPTPTPTPPIAPIKIPGPSGIAAPTSSPSSAPSITPAQ